MPNPNYIHPVSYDFSADLEKLSLENRNLQAQNLALISICKMDEKIHAEEQAKQQRIIGALRAKYPAEHDAQVLEDDTITQTLSLVTHKLNGTSFKTMASVFVAKNVSIISFGSEMYFVYIELRSADGRTITLSATNNQLRRKTALLDMLTESGIQFFPKMSNSRMEQLLRGYIFQKASYQQGYFMGGWNFTANSSVPRYVHAQITEKCLLGEIASQKYLRNPTNKVPFSSLAASLESTSDVFFAALFHSIISAASLQSLFAAHGSYWNKPIIMHSPAITESLEIYLQDHLQFFTTPTKIPRLPMGKKDLQKILSNANDEIILFEITGMVNKHDSDLLRQNLSTIMSANHVCNHFVPIILSASPVCPLSSLQMLRLDFDKFFQRGKFFPSKKPCIGNFLINFTEFVQANFSDVTKIIHKALDTNVVNISDIFYIEEIQLLVSFQLLQKFYALKNASFSFLNETMYGVLKNWFLSQTKLADSDGVSDLFIERFSRLCRSDIVTLVSPDTPIPSDCILPIWVTENVVFFRPNDFRDKILRFTVSGVAAHTLLEELYDTNVLETDNTTVLVYQKKKLFTSASGKRDYQRFIVLKRRYFEQLGQPSPFEF